MKRLHKGISQFQQHFYNKERELYQSLAKGQSPDVLVFSCSDSRVNMNLITQSKPGELFVVKNVGNIIPASGPHRKKTCQAAAVEFALEVLKVSDIIICGHSDCGALKALYLDEKAFDRMPNLKDWIDTARPVKEHIEHDASDPMYKARMKMLEQKHVVAQLENLRTYSLVKQAIKEEKITLHAWYYEIETGNVYAYDSTAKTFEKIAYKDDETTESAQAVPCPKLQ